MSHQYTVVGMGEVLWDRFPDGAKFGGAPANFACSTAGLPGNQANVFIASGIGDDELGRQSIESLRERSVDTSFLQVRPQPTGTVTVEIDHDGNASYTFANETAWDNLQWTEDWRQFAITVDAVYFGTLGQRSQRSRDAIMQFLNATRSKSLRVFDVNVRRPFVTDIQFSSHLNEPTFSRSMKKSSCVSIKRIEYAMG
jgi:fructokinase